MVWDLNYCDLMGGGWGGGSCIAQRACSIPVTEVFVTEVTIFLTNPNCLGCSGATIQALYYSPLSSADSCESSRRRFLDSANTGELSGGTTPTT